MSLLNAYSLEFVRPVYHALKNSNVIIRVSYSRTGGMQDYVVVTSFGQFLLLLKKLPKQAIVRWMLVPDNFCGPQGIIPDENRALMLGAY